MRPSCNKYKRTGGTTRVATLRVAWLTHFQLVGRLGRQSAWWCSWSSSWSSPVYDISYNFHYEASDCKLYTWELIKSSPQTGQMQCNAQMKWNKCREREREQKGKRKAAKQITRHVKEVKEKTLAKLVDIVGKKEQDISRIAAELPYFVLMALIMQYAKNWFFFFIFPAL